MIADQYCLKPVGQDDAVNNRIWALQWNHKGSVLASCGDDKTIRLWSFAPDTKRLVNSSTIIGSHCRTIRSLAFSPDDKYLASAGFDSVVVIHQLYSGDYEEVNRLEGHEHEVKCCSFSICGQFLASCSRDRSVWVWQLNDADDLEVSSILQSHTQDVKFVLWHPTDEVLVSCGYDCSIIFHQFDGDEWVTQQKIESAHSSTVWCADFSSDGKSLATVGADCMINVWGQQKKLFSKKFHWIKVVSLQLSERWPLYSISWNKSHETIAVGGGAGVLSLIRLVDDGNGGKMLDLVSNIKLTSEINCVQWNPKNENQLASANDSGIIYIFDVAF